MNIRPIITDEQLRDLRDGLLPALEQRLVTIQTEVDENLAARYSAIRSEMPRLALASPGAGFSTKIMAQLAADGLVHEPVYRKRSKWIIWAIFLVFAGMLIGSLFVVFKNMPTATVHLPTIGGQIDWTRLVNSRAFLWSVWLGCLLPAIMLAHNQFNRPKDFVY